VRLGAWSGRVIIYFLQDLNNNDMNTKFLYNTVSNAVTLLRNAGFTMDFHLKNSDIFLDERKVDINDLKIVKFFRYEGESDPADEASVYGLESTTGLKGILVTGDESNSESSFSKILKKLHLKLLGRE